MQIQGGRFWFGLFGICHYWLSVTVDMFRPEIEESLRAYASYIVCIDKTPDECEVSLISLVEKAIKAYESRGPNLRHGIALDRYITIILSQTETEKPLCGIYFNLFSPYSKKLSTRLMSREESGGVGG